MIEERWIPKIPYPFTQNEIFQRSFYFQRFGFFKFKTHSSTRMVVENKSTCRSPREYAKTLRLLRNFHDLILVSYIKMNGKEEKLVYSLLACCYFKTRLHILTQVLSFPL